MASAGERALSVGLTLLVVLSVVGGGVAPSPVGTASAQSADTDECSTWDSMIYDLTTIGNLNTEDENPCSAEYQRQQLADEWNETDADQTRTQIHSQAGQTAAGTEQHLTVMGNGLEESDTIAFSKGEAAAVEELANGGNVSEAQAAANESVDGYYAVKQTNLVDRWNVIVQTTVTLNSRANETEGVDGDYVTAGTEDDFEAILDNDGEVDSSDNSAQVQGDGNGTITTLNGTELSIDTVQGNYSGFDGDEGSYSGRFISQPVDVDGETLDIDGMKVRQDSNAVRYVTHIRVRPSDDLTSTIVVDISSVSESWKDIESESESTKEEVAVYVNDSLGPAVQNGELDAQNYVSPSTLAQEYSQDYNGTESYIQATAIATYAGMDTPDLEDTGSMTISYNGSNYEGLMLSQEAPSDGWESGESYDPALLSGLQMFAVAGEDGEVIELEESFTVEEVTGTDGEEIDRATTVNVTYETTNESANYTAMQEQIRALNEDIEERQAEATSGGGGGDSGTNPLDALASFLGVSAGAAVVVIAGIGLLAVRIYSP